nr:DUF2894 domain-containing protein [Dechloromonas sp.]
MADSGTPGKSLPEGETQALIAAWRAQGADRRDPVRFRFIESLARRTAAQHGAARALLDTRLALALDDFAERLAREAPAPVTGATEASEPALGGLGELLALLAQHLPERPVAAGTPAVAPVGGERMPAAPDELKAMTYFRSTWSMLSIERQLAEAIERAPENAGPLNSHHLVLRALQRMRDTSPAYLQRYLSYVDALFWLEQAQADSPRPPGAKRVASSDGEAPRRATRRKTG